MPSTRTATPEDAALVAYFREAMLRGMGHGDAATLDAMSRGFTTWVEERLKNGVYLGWITEDEGRPVASAGLFLMDWPPHPLDPKGATRGYLLNVYVDPAYRRRRLAKELTRMAMDECAKRGVAMMTLHASDAGRPVYEGLGFTPGNEMQRRIAER